MTTILRPVPEVLPAEESPREPNSVLQATLNLVVAIEQLAELLVLGRPSLRSRP